MVSPTALTCNHYAATCTKISPEILHPKNSENGKNAPGKARKRRNRVRSGCWREVQRVRTDGKTGIDRHRTCLGCRLGRFAAERHWRSLTPRHALRRGAAVPRCRVLMRANEKREASKCLSLFFGRGRRTRTLGTRFWSGCGKMRQKGGNGRCCPAPPTSLKEGGAGLVLWGNFAGRKQRKWEENSRKNLSNNTLPLQRSRSTFG